MLSRNNLYAPLVAYEQTDVVPSAYMINQTSTPKAIQESSLVSFLQGISQDYHREEAMPNDPKNNGSRPTSLSDVQSKIRQRAVAIVGGQVTASMTSTTTGASTKNRKRKRKEISWNDIEEIVKRQTIAIPSMPSRIGSIEFLRELNAKWNEYIRSALQLNNSANDTSSIMSRFAALREDVELVGAHVRIGSCSQRKGLTSCYGVVVSERKNTWAVATLQSQRKQKKKVVSNTEKEEVGGDQNVDMLVVPKRGTTLILVVPLRHTEKDAPRTSTLVDDEEIISLSQRSICIVLNGSESNYS